MIFIFISSTCDMISFSFFFQILGNLIGDKCEDDNDGDGVTSDDTCPNIKFTSKTDFRENDFVIFKPDEDLEKYVYTIFAEVRNQHCSHMFSFFNSLRKRKKPQMIKN